MIRSVTARLRSGTDERLRHHRPAHGAGVPRGDTRPAGLHAMRRSTRTSSWPECTDGWDPARRRLRPLRSARPCCSRTSRATTCRSSSACWPAGSALPFSWEAKRNGWPSICSRRLEHPVARGGHRSGGRGPVPGSGHQTAIRHPEIHSGRDQYQEGRRGLSEHGNSPRLRILRTAKRTSPSIACASMDPTP